LFFKYMEMGLELGYVAEPTLHMQLAKQFEVPAVRYFWGSFARDAFATDARNRSALKFFEIADKQYRQALTMDDADTETAVVRCRADKPESQDARAPRKRRVRCSRKPGAFAKPAAGLAAAALAVAAAGFARRRFPALIKGRD
jgi:hypothetical protein